MGELSLACLDAIVQKLMDAAAPDMKRIEADMQSHGTAFYRLDADGSVRHMPLADVVLTDLTDK